VSTWTSSALAGPVENGCIESFNGKIRDECLNVKAFSLVDAREKLASWRATTTTTSVRTRRLTTELWQSSPPPG
jgi:Integrase core domain